MSNYKRPVSMLTILILALLVSMIAVCLMPTFDNITYVNVIGGSNGAYIASHVMSNETIQLYMLGLYITIFFDAAMLIGYAAKRTKTISIISIVFVVLSVVYSALVYWACSVGFQFHSMFLYSTLLILLVYILSFVAAVIGIAKASNRKAQQIREIEAQLESLS